MPSRKPITITGSELKRPPSRRAFIVRFQFSCESFAEPRPPVKAHSPCIERVSSTGCGAPPHPPHEIQDAPAECDIDDVGQESRPGEPGPERVLCMPAVAPRGEDLFGGGGNLTAGLLCQRLQQRYVRGERPVFIRIRVVEALRPRFMRSLTADAPARFQLEGNGLRTWR